MDPESANMMIPVKADASTNNENQKEPLVSVIRKLIERPVPLISTVCRIYRVPNHLRNLKKEAYTPRVISIGPFHHGQKEFENMENHKEIYLKKFIEKTNIDLEELVTIIMKQEASIRSCYAESIKMKSDDFVKMILLDATFILVLFLGHSLKDWKFDDPMLVHPLRAAVRFDLLLLENQLPFFVIKTLFDHFLQKRDSIPSLIRLTWDFFIDYVYNRVFSDDDSQERKAPSDLKIIHFTDLLRTVMLSPSLADKDFKLPVEDCKPLPKPIEKWYTATQLHEAGVKFKVATSGRFLDIKFKKGVLEIPRLLIEDDTEARARNVMALEQTHYVGNEYIANYFFVMDLLINTTKDVNLLCDKNIVVNYLGDNTAARVMINKLNKGILLENMTPEYRQLCLDLNDFYEKPWHSWMATLRHVYFSTPWRSASTIAAIILLVLTFIQTIFSIL